MTIKIVVSGSIDFPALDKLVDLLQSKVQDQINATAAQVQSITTRLRTSQTTLQSVITKETT